MNSRERVVMALNHQEPDRVPVDLGGCHLTGMHVTTVYKLRQAYGLDAPGTPVKVMEPYQMLGEIQPDLLEVVGGDVLNLMGRENMFGFENTNWRPWTYHDGTPVLVPEFFNTDPEPNGDLLMYAKGDKSYEAAARLPAGGWYFDSIVRQPEFDDSTLDVNDNLEEFSPISQADLDHIARESKRLFESTDKALLHFLSGTAFGDIALVPGPMLKAPKGIRDIEEWYVSLLTRPDYVREIFERQCAIALDNLPKVYAAVGDRPVAVIISGTDFGAQNGPFISPKTFCALHKPFLTQVNDWIHQNTNWKCFIHSCGSIMPLIPHFIEAGFDILNPVQTTAVNMAPEDLKAQFGDKVTFWGGGVDTQRVLPFGTPEEVREDVKRNLDVFMPGGGFIFASIHNIQALTPVENLLAMYETVKEYGRYSIGV